MPSSFHLYHIFDEPQKSNLLQLYRIRKKERMLKLDSNLKD